MKKIMKRSLPKISGALQFIRYDVLAVSVCHLVVPVVTLVGYDCFAVERGVVHTVDPGLPTRCPLNATVASRSSWSLLEVSRHRKKYLTQTLIVHLSKTHYFIQKDRSEKITLRSV